MKRKVIHYAPSIENPCKFEEAYIPIQKYTNTFSGKSAFSFCPVWQHQTSRIFTVYASCNLHLQIDINNGSIFSNTLNQEQFNKYIMLNQNWNEEEFTTVQISGLFTNFYWTKEKNVWISILPHPLTSLNNNFYHCGAWFNLSNWSRKVNIGAIVVDNSKPLIIKRGDPLYNIRFHTHNQNDDFELIQSQSNAVDEIKSSDRADFVNSELSKDFNYHHIIFDSSYKSRCPFRFPWRNK